MGLIEKIVDKNSFVFSFLVVGIIIYSSFWFAKKILKDKIPGSAIAISLGLVLAYFGGKRELPMYPFLQEWLF